MRVVREFRLRCCWVESGYLHRTDSHVLHDSSICTYRTLSCIEIFVTIDLEIEYKNFAESITILAKALTRVIFLSRS